MKLKTVNVVEVVDFTITQILSFTDNKKGNREQGPGIGDQGRRIGWHGYQELQGSDRLAEGPPLGGTRLRDHSLVSERGALRPVTG